MFKSLLPIALSACLFVGSAYGEEAKATAPIAPTNDGVKSLRDEMLTLIASNDRRYVDALAAQKEATAASFAALKDTTALSLAAQKEAVNKAEEASTKRFESVNEFRQTLTDQAKTFMTISEAAARFDSNKKDITELKDILQKMQAKSSGIADAVGYFVGLVGVVIGILGFIIKRKESKESNAQTS